MLLTYYNQGGIGLLDDVLNEACEGLLDIQDLKAVAKTGNWLTCSRCAIFHNAPDHDVKKFYASLCNADIVSTDGLVVFLVSSAEISDATKRVEFRGTNGIPGIRYVLPIRHTKAGGFSAAAKDGNYLRAVKKWKALFQDVLDPGKLDDWFTYPKRRGISPILDEAFRDVYNLEPLANLAILCQTWLVAHAGKTDRIPQHTASLKQMGWLDWNDEDPEAAKLSEVVRMKTNDTGWWLKCLGVEDWSAFQAAVQAAWGDADRSKLDELMGLLEKRSSLEVSVVAEAYCQLAIKLGGKQCPAI